MSNGKRVLKNSRKSNFIVLVLVLVLGLCSAGGTIAWIASSTNSVTNTFVPAKVENHINEDVTTNVKKNVTVTNTGDVSAYVRAAVIVNWVDSNGNVAVPPQGATYSVDYNIGDAEEQWTVSGGYYYYNSIVPKSGTTGNLIDEAKETNAPNGYHLQVTIVAESIQADGMGATSAQDAWSKALASKNS